jgi:hypothetical protein
MGICSCLPPDCIDYSRVAVTGIADRHARDEVDIFGVTGTVHVNTLGSFNFEEQRRRGSKAQVLKK